MRFQLLPMWFVFAFVPFAVADEKPTPQQVEAAKAGFGAMLQTYYPGVDPHSKETIQLFVLKNSVTGDDMKKFPDLPFAFSLNLNGGIARNGAIKELAHLKKLTRLNVAGTFITDEGFADIKLLPSVNTLGTDRFQTTEKLLKTLNEVGRLHILGSFRGAGGKRPASAKEVESIDLQSMFKINDAALKELAAFTNVKEIDLGSTSITDEGLKELAAFKNLTLLKLQAKPEKVTDAGLSELQKVMPKLKIVK